MNKKKNPPICMCHNVPQEKIHQAISRGCNSLPKIFDATTAGVGPCGGSCRPLLQKILDHYMATGEFPENPRLVLKKKS